MLSTLQKANFYVVKFQLQIIPNSTQKDNSHTNRINNQEHPDIICTGSVVTESCLLKIMFTLIQDLHQCNKAATTQKQTRRHKHGTSRQICTLLVPTHESSLQVLQFNIPQPTRVCSNATHKNNSPKQFTTIANCHVICNCNYVLDFEALTV